MNGTEIKRIRDSLQASQSEFSDLLGVSVRTLQNWEQDRNEPNTAAIVLLRLAEAGKLRRKKK